MKNFIFFLLFFVPVFGFAQSNNEKDYLIGEWEMIETNNPDVDISRVYKYIFESNGDLTRISGSKIDVGDFSYKNKEITIEYGLGDRYRKIIFKVERLNDQILVAKVGDFRYAYKKN